MAGRTIVVVVALVGASAGAQTQKITLELRPRVGDTISMRLEQETEVSRRRDGEKAAPAPAPAASMSGITVTFSRAVVESAVPAYTTIVAITDSVVMSSAEGGRATAPAPRHQSGGPQVRLMIAPDGSVTMPADGAQAPRALARNASLIPATFPADPVRVGDQWSREAPLPAGTSQFGAGVIGRVKAFFRLDSLTHGGNLAWVSINGSLTPDPKAKSADGFATVEDGTVSGYMVVDRARGWLTESRFTIVAHSALRPAFGVVSQPMYFTMRLTQSLHASDQK
jgi:hypothetical protein